MVVVENPLTGTAFSHCVWICPYFQGCHDEDAIEDEVSRIGAKIVLSMAKTENQQVRLKE